MSTEYLTIRQMCDLFEVTPRTLRFYESKELLSPVREGQKRLFAPRDRRRLRTILRAKRFGFSLEAIREMLQDASCPRHERLERVETAARRQLDELKRQREELDHVIADLDSQLETARPRPH